MRSWRDVPGLKWLYPGMGVKRWLLLLMAGVTSLSLALAYFLVAIYRQQPLPPVFYYLTLQFVPRLLRAALFAMIGLSAVGLAVYRLNRSLLAVLPRPGHDSLVDLVYQHRQLARGARVVAIGGGTGLSTLLRGMKEYSANLTAIVTVADDGGSSGRLRRELGVLPPGDFRNCIAALADAEPLMTELFQYRFGEGQGLNGHSFGNLFIAAMAGVTGNFERAIAESSRVLAVRGRILPSTLAHVTLCAEMAGSGEQARQVEGESQIPQSGLPIARVYLEPNGVQADAQALRAILQADLIVLGPGSLYTSVLPNLLVEEVAEAIRVSRALKVYVCNVAVQPGETDGYNVEDHVRAIESHVGEGLIDVVVANNDLEVPAHASHRLELVQPVYRLQERIPIAFAPLADSTSPWRHDPDKLARCLLDLHMRFRGGEGRFASSAQTLS
jgi:uncharacterized cofD-like protein